MRLDRAYLLDIIEATKDIDRYRTTRSASDEDERTRAWMVNRLQIIGEAARRVSDELRARQPALDQAVTTLEAQAGAQHAAQVYATSQTAEKEALREDLRLHHMQPIAAIARRNLAGTPQITKLKLGPKKLDDVRLVAAANGMAQAAALYTQVFLDHKLPPDFIAELQAASDAVQGAVATRNAALQQMKTATQTLADQTTDARGAVTVLNALVVKQLKGRGELLAAWQMAKQINDKPGVPRGTSRKPAPTAVPKLVLSGTSGTSDSPSTPAATPEEPSGASAA